MSRRSAHPLIRKAEPSFRGPFAPLLAVMALIGFACLPQPLSWLGLPVALIVPGHLVLLIMGVADDYNVVSRAALAAVASLGVYPLLALAAFAATEKFSRLTVIVGVVALGLTAAATEFARRRESTRVGSDVPHERHPSWRSNPSMTALIPVTVGLLIVAIGPRMIPPPDPAPFVTMELSGTWAFVDRAVTPTSGPLKVDVEIGNMTDAQIFGRLVVTVDRQPLADHTEVNVGAGARIIEAVVLPPLAGGCAHDVTIGLELVAQASTSGSESSALPDVTPSPLQFFVGQNNASKPC